MIDVEHITRHHFDRIGLSAVALRQDPTYYSQHHWVRDWVQLLAVVLDDEGVPDRVAERIVRGVLYGAPTEEAARERMVAQDRMVQMLSAAPPVVAMSEEETRKAMGL